MVDADWTRAQQSVVGSVLISPQVLPLVLRICKPSDMMGTCATIYGAMQELQLAGAVVDPVTVLERVGPAYRDELERVMRETPTAANAEAYAEICAEQSRLARLHVLAAQLLDAPRMDDALPLLQRMMEVTAANKAESVVSIQRAVIEFFERHSGAAPEYIPFGIPKLDARLTAELGDVVVLGGYPSDGKSALMLQWCWELSKKYRVGVYSLETRKEKLTDRFVAQAGAIGLDAIKHNRMGQMEWSLASLVGRQADKRTADLIECAGWTVSDILATALAHRHQIVMIDYVQLIEPGSARRGGTRAEEVAAISKALHTMAQRHGILVVELSQLTEKETVTVKGKKIELPPTLSSLRESRQLSQDADVIMLLYRTQPDNPASPRRLHIAKNKEGTTGYVNLRFRGSIQRFEEAEEEEDLDARFAGEAKKRRDKEAAARHGQEELPT